MCPCNYQVPPSTGDEIVLWHGCVAAASFTLGNFNASPSTFADNHRNLGLEMSSPAQDAYCWYFGHSLACELVVSLETDIQGQQFVWWQLCAKKVQLCGRGWPSMNHCKQHTQELTIFLTFCWGKPQQHTSQPTEIKLNHIST